MALTENKSNCNSFSEELAKRTPWTKSFHVLPYKHRTMSFAEQVHYLNRESGAYEAVDNTLIGCEGGLQNKANGDMRVALLRNKIALTHPDGYRLSWRIDGAEVVEPKVITPEIDRKAAVRDAEEDLYGHIDDRPVSEEVKAARAKIAEALVDELSRVGSEAIYKGILPGTDLVCKLSGTNFKDHLVFSTKESVKPVTFVFESDGLTIQETEAGLVLLNKQEETVYTFPVPVCMDSKEGFEQQEVKYTIKKTGEEGQFAITYTLPEEWLEKAAFPVILDPAVVTYNARCAIQDAYTCSQQPNTAHSGSNTNILRLTKGSSGWGLCLCFFRFGEGVLPSLDSSDYIVYAQFRVATAQSGYPTSAFDATAHEVTSSWTPGTLKHSQMPSYDSRILDYSRFNQNEGEGHYHTFDITNLVRKWYGGPNNGVMLKAQSNTYAQLRSSAYTQNTGYRPLVIIDYFSKAGLESYLSYESHSIGRTGTGYVSLFNGNLIFEHQDTVATGNIMPVSVKHYYNSCYRTISAFHIGCGWKINIQQVLRKETISGILYYTWVDDDGTEVYFAQANGIWKDLTGREMTLTIANSSATITDKQGLKRIFGVPTVEFNNDWTNVKPMTRMENVLEQHIDITYNGLMPQSITDGVGRVTSPTWDVGLLAHLCPPGDSTGIAFMYPAGQLAGIQYQDELWSWYNYQQDGSQLLSTVVGVDGTYVHYEYTGTEPYRVTRVWINSVYDEDKILFDHSYDYRDILTIVTDNLSGKKIRYHFNDNGNLVCISDELGYGASSTYTVTGPLNKPEAISKLQRSVINLVRDPIFTKNDVWIEASAGGTGSLSYDTSEHYVSARSMRINKTNTTGSYLGHQTVTLTPGKMYTFSAWAKTSGDTAAQLFVHISKASGGTIPISTALKQLTNGWQRITLTFDMPTDDVTGSANVYLVAEAGVGTVWYDGVQLEEGVTPSRLNLLSNCDFRNGTTDWTIPSGATGGSVCAISTLEDASTYPEGLSGQAYKMMGAGTGSIRRVSQEIGISGIQNESFVAGGWSAAHSAPRGSATERYRMELSFYNGSSWTTGGEILWGEEWSGWKFAAAPILASCDYTKVRLTLCYEGNYNEAAFGGLFLHKEEFGQSYTYDSKGNVISTTDAAELKDHAEYDEYNNLTEYRQPGRPVTVKTTLSYGTTDAEKQQRLLKQIVSPIGIQTDYSHDTHGNVTETQVSHNGLMTKSSVGYSADGNYALTKTDARGNTTTRTVDSNLGTVGSVTDPLNHTVTYTHDVMKRVTQTQTTEDGKTYLTTYTYANDRLDQVTRRTAADDSNPVIYKFHYDVFGRPTVTKVGTDITLSTTSYNADGTVQGVTFGNNGKVDYVYDSFKRLIGVKFDNSSAVRFAYTYGNNGEVAQVIDSSLGRVVRSEYDLANRPIRKLTFTTAGTPIYEAQVGYDEYGNLSEFKETVAGNESHATNFTYDDENRPTVLTYENGQAVTYTYDALGRIQKRSVGAEGSEVETTYTYENGVGSSTTPLIHTISQNGVTLTYTYDYNGNITSVSDGTKTTSYVYDGIGQLIRVNDQTDTTADTTGTTWVFTYDLSGNILTKVAYPYTTGTVGMAAESHTFSYGATTIGGITYGTNAWKDQLAAIDGVGITYDPVGNPTNDGTWSYTWQHGKQLQQMQKTEAGVTTTVQFEYNEDGLRTKKTVTVGNDTVVTEYVLHGKNIVHMTRDSDNLHFLFDAQGKPAEMIFNGTAYRYLYNLQGDVVALVNTNGTKVVEYGYDAWGKLTWKTGSLAGTLGSLQPFRYRGYVFDEETGLYYLRSRYYRPSWGRFVSADVKISDNIYTYCGNNPVRFGDYDGYDRRFTCPNCELFGTDEYHYILYNKDNLYDEYETDDYPISAKVTKDTVYAVTKKSFVWALHRDEEVYIRIVLETPYIAGLEFIVVRGGHYAASVFIDCKSLQSVSGLTGTIHSKKSGRAGLVNVRSSTSTSGQNNIVSSLESGTSAYYLDSITIERTGYTWYLISGDFGLGFVRSDFFDLTGSPD